VEILIQEQPHDSSTHVLKPPCIWGPSQRYVKWICELNLHFYVCTLISFMQDLIVEPIDYFTTMILIDKFQWIKAMVEEYNSLLLNKMWELVALLTWYKTMRCKWVYKLEFAYDGIISSYKICLIVKGFTQNPSINLSNKIKLLFAIFYSHYFINCCPIYGHHPLWCENCFFSWSIVRRNFHGPIVGVWRPHLSTHSTQAQEVHIWIKTNISCLE
jgi:hypothetical protein